MQWFCEEIKKDIQEHLQGTLLRKPQNLEPNTQAIKEHPEEVEHLISQVQQHPRCHAVQYLPSRLTLRILKKCVDDEDKTTGKDIRLMKLGKYLKAKRSGAAVPTESPLDVAFSKAMQFLDTLEEDQDGQGLAGEDHEGPQGPMRRPRLKRLRPFSARPPLRIKKEPEEIE